MGIREAIGKWINDAERKVNKLIARGQGELYDDSEVTRQARKLVAETESLLQEHKDEMPREAIASTREFIAEMNQIIKEDQADRYAKQPIRQFNTATRYLETIYKHQPDMEAAPGFWNKLHSKINTFLEALTGEKNLLGTPKQSAIGKSVDFQKYKSKIAKIRDELQKPDQSDDYKSTSRIQPK